MGVSITVFGMKIGVLTAQILRNSSDGKSTAWASRLFQNWKPEIFRMFPSTALLQLTLPVNQAVFLDGTNPPRRKGTYNVLLVESKVVYLTDVRTG